MEHLANRERFRELGLCSLQQKDQGDLTNYLHGEEQRLCSVVPSDKIRRNRNKLEYRKMEEKITLFLTLKGDWTFKQVDLLSGCSISICADPQSLTGQSTSN